MQIKEQKINLLPHQFQIRIVLQCTSTPTKTIALLLPLYLWLAISANAK